MLRLLVISLLILVSLPALGASKTLELFVDKGELFVRAGKDHGLKVGAQLDMLGDTIGGTQERRRVGKAKVLEVWDTVARLRLDKAARKAGAKHAMLETPETQQSPKASQGATPARRDVPHAPVWSSGLSDELGATCEGIAVRVLGRSVLTGAGVQLVLDNLMVDTGEVSVGGRLVLRGTAKEKEVVLQVSQGLIGTDYSVAVDGKSCRLYGS